MDDSSIDNQPAKKRARTKNFTIQHKVLIIDLLDGSNFSQLNPQCRQLEKQECVRQHLMKTQDLKLGRSTISEIYKNKNGLIAIVKSDSSKFTQKSLKTSKYHNLEVMLADWVIMMRNEGLHVSGDAIQAKALEIAKSISIEDFKASCGWLCKFKERFKLSKRTESDNCDYLVCLNKLPIKEDVASNDSTVDLSNHTINSSNSNISGSISLNSNNNNKNNICSIDIESSVVVYPIDSYRPINICSAIDFITQTLDSYNTSKDYDNKLHTIEKNHINSQPIVGSANKNTRLFPKNSSLPVPLLHDDVVIPYAGGLECLHKAVQLVQQLHCVGYDQPKGFATTTTTTSITTTSSTSPHC